jgi:hypothetical protein
MKRLSDLVDPKNTTLVESGENGMVLMSPLLAVLIEGCAQFLRETGAENYVESTFDSDDFGPLLLTIQKRVRNPTAKAEGLRGNS